MTQLAEPAGSASTSLPTIGHWIGGRHVQGTSGRQGPVFNPATGVQAKWVDFASEEELDAAVAAAKPGNGANHDWARADLDVNEDGTVDQRDLEALDARGAAGSEGGASAPPAS